MMIGCLHNPQTPSNAVQLVNLHYTTKKANLVQFLTVTIAVYHRRQISVTLLHTFMSRCLTCSDIGSKLSETLDLIS
jgi:hypothetical protein